MGIIVSVFLVLLVTPLSAQESFRCGDDIANLLSAEGAGIVQLDSDGDKVWKWNGFPPRGVPRQAATNRR